MKKKVWSFQTGPPNGAAVLILMKDRRGGLEEVARVHERIAVKLKGVAVELIGAALNHRVEDSTRVPAIFGIDGAGDEIEFADGVRAGNDERLIQPEVHGVGAIDQERILLALAAVGGVVTARAEAIAAAHHARNKLLELSPVAARAAAGPRSAWRR